MEGSLKIKIDKGACRAIDAKIREAVFLTAEALHTEVIQAQVIPFDTGNLQNESTYVTKESDGATLRSVTPYAARLYFHPEYNFQKVNNRNAQGRWLEPWISGKNKDFCKETFASLIKRRVIK